MVGGVNTVSGNAAESTGPGFSTTTFTTPGVDKVVVADRLVVLFTVVGTAVP